MENGENKFKVTISDDDYNALSKNIDIPISSDSARPVKSEKFEVNIDDDVILNLSEEDAAPEYKGEIYFSNVRPKPVTPPPAATQKKASSKKQEVVFKAAKPQKKRKEKANRSFSLFAAVLLIVAFSVSAVGIVCVNDLLAFNRSEDSVTVNIPVDADTDTIIDILHDNGLVKMPAMCKLYNKAFFYVKNINKKEKKLPVYNSGVYDVEKNLGLEGYLTKFKETQTSNETVTAVFPEGWSIAQIIDRLDKYDICSKSKVTAAIKNGSYDYAFLAAQPDDDRRCFKLEGYLYPDTYEFYLNTDANSVIRKMLEHGDEMWTDEYQKRADELHYTRDEILTIASIIQREAANKSQMTQISSVLHNRLNHSASWPTLGCDSTLKYVENYLAPLLDVNQLLKYKSTYSTAINKGLPPGPICNPGDDAIQAALYPDETNYYFFRHDKTGKIYLAATQSEHDHNANLVLRANSQN